MSTSDTPRTDAAHDPTSPEILYFEAKKMEKELTAAQEHAERLRVALVRVLASAHPSDKDNPAMYAAWALAKEALAAPSGQRSCVWTHNEHHGYWVTSCGKSYTFDYDISEDVDPFCPGCGKRTELAHTAPETITQEETE